MIRFFCFCSDYIYKYQPHRITVDLGVTDSSLGVDPKARLYTVNTIVTHPLWNSSVNFAADVALLYIEDYIEYTDYIQPACLPDSIDQYAEQIECYITGWGALEGYSSECHSILRNMFHWHKTILD